MQTEADVAETEANEVARSQLETGDGDDESLDHGHDQDDAGSDAFDAESDLDDDNVDAAVDPVFRRQVAQALQVTDPLEEEQEDDSGFESAEESDWDDEQMLAVDERLAEVFRQQARAKQRTSLKRPSLP